MVRPLIFAGAALAASAAFAAMLSMVAPPHEEHEVATVQAKSEPAPATEATPAKPRADLQDVERRVARNVTPPGIYSGPIRMVPEKPPEPEPEPETHTFHRVVIREAGIFTDGDTVIRLAGLDVPGLEESCTDEEGETWPCGRAATAALRRLVRNRSVECDVVRETEDGIAGICRVGRREINDWLVEQGWAMPAGGAPESVGGVVAADYREGEVPPPVDIPEPMAPLQTPASAPAAPGFRLSPE